MDYSGIQMVDSNGVLKTGLKKPTFTCECKLTHTHKHTYIDGSRAIVVWVLAKVLN